MCIECLVSPRCSIDGRLTLPYSRYLTTYLVLIALLCSNVAGWVHVGCCTPTDQSEVAVAQNCCCRHRCERVDTSEKNSGEQQLPQEHDPSTCSVCQNFFASRDAVPTVGNEFIWVIASTTRNCVAPDHFVVRESFQNSPSLRGPPRV